ncbi:MAG: DUF4910 domain-containing protein [Gemmatimonadetes bacterium]|nr:DUF4910 domain-containing protein [Gemmatimonadota bacterium]
MATHVRAARAAGVGEALHAFITELYPIGRSITGDGVRETLRRIQRELPLQVHEVPTGTRVFDWTVPREWNIRDAWIKNLAGERVVDFRKSNLHVVSYSIPVRTRVSLKELREHLHSIPDHPGWIPYKTSYYAETWGFCVAHETLQSLGDPEYDVCIDSSLTDGSLTYGELELPGETADEVLLSTHICHPSLANDNLSGGATAVFLARWLMELRGRRLSYRFLFVPGTIGAITWLARNPEKLAAIRAGLVLTGLGAPAKLVYKRSRRGNTAIDRAAVHVLAHSGRPHEIRDFSPYGYDERQYCSPGINLPVGCLSRNGDDDYPEHHTSADDGDFVRPEVLADSYEACRAILRVLDADCVYVSLNPMCEPQLGRRGLYGSLGGAGERRTREMALLWVLNLADGEHTLLDMAERAGLPFATIESAARLLEEHGLLERRAGSEARPR